MMDPEKKSRSQMRREALELHKLGEQLVALSSEQLAQIPLEVELKEAVTAAQGFTKHGARRRQLRYIGGLIRQMDPDPIRKSLERVDQGRRLDTAVFIQIESWRDRLITGDEPLRASLLERFPDMDPDRIARLIRNTQQEKKSGGPSKSGRGLFRYLKPFVQKWMEAQNRDE
jgi:ribosome-associated protein